MLNEDELRPLAEHLPELWQQFERQIDWYLQQNRPAVTDMVVQAKEEEPSSLEDINDIVHHVRKEQKGIC